MMNRILLVLALFAIPFFPDGQSDLNLLGHLDIQSIHGFKLNDVWGYEDELGNEYALVGTRGGVSIVDVSDPANPQEVYWHPGPNSVWRDLKVWNDKVYVTTEAIFGGLLIIDLEPLPASPPTDTWVVNSGPMANWSSAHNLFIDEQGYMYVFGATGTGNPSDGVLIFDLNTSDTSLAYVGAFDQAYCHDGFVRNDTGYFAHINDGYFTVVDLSDRANPVVLGQMNTPSNFTHNVWPSDDSQTLFTTDEKPFSYLAAYDISNLGIITETDRVKSGDRAEELPHNTFFMDDYLYTAYYTAGVTVHDVSRPNNIIEVARYDTDSTHPNGTNGCWGVYPYFSSSLIAATDIDNGLFLFQAQLERAAFLEGHVSDQSTGFPLPGVLVSLIGGDQDLTSAGGDYATGDALGGSYQVRFYRYGYQVDTLPVQLFNDSVVILDHQMVPLPSWDLTVTVENDLGTPIPSAPVKIVGQVDTLEATTNGVGQTQFTLVYPGTYRVLAGKWGYDTRCLDSMLTPSETAVTLALDTGYADDFELDLGWTTLAGAITGNWERAEAYEIHVNYTQTPGYEAPWDCGNMCYLTGSGHAGNADDVDNGFTILTSPKMDLRGYADPYLSYWRWYACLYNTQDDTMRIELMDGSNVVLLDTAFFQGQPEWDWKEFRVSDYLTPDSAMRIRITVSDFMDENIVEANFDGFKVTEGSVADLKEQPQTITSVSIYPNPGSHSFAFDLPPDASGQVRVLDPSGRLVRTGMVNGTAPVDASDLGAGLYLVQLKVEGQVHNFRWLKRY